MYAAARSAIHVAHALDQRDPDIRRLWIASLPAQQRIDELTKFLQTLPPQSEAAKRVAQQIESRKAEAEAGEHHPCKLVSSVESTSIPMQAILFDMTHIDKWGIDTLISGKTARLAVDSGATGLVVGRAFAEHAGLKFVEETRVGGFGDHGPQKAHIALADTIRIGKLEFSDCEVLVTDHRDVIGLDGLIGTDVFRSYLVSVNFPDKRLDLAALPPRPGGADASPVSQSLSTNSDTDAQVEQPAVAAASHVPQDRYIAPEMKSFTPVYRFGHLLLIDTSVNDGPAELMVLDTGNFTMSLDEKAARAVTHAHIDTVDGMRGLSGRVEKLSVGGTVTLRFGHARASITDIVVMDHERMSRDIGTEISGFIGFPALQSVVFQIDYRDGLVNFVYDPKKDANRAKAPGTECSYCNPGYSQR
jgi:predicted aspartyl protease